MYYTGTFKCVACDAILVVGQNDWTDLGAGTMTPELRKRLEGWSCKKGVWYCPLHPTQEVPHEILPTSKV